MRVSGGKLADQFSDAQLLDLAWGNCQQLDQGTKMETVISDNIHYLGDNKQAQNLAYLSMYSAVTSFCQDYRDAYIEIANS